MTHQKESEYEGGGIKLEFQQCDNRCPKAAPEFIYFLLCCCSRTSRLLLSPTSSGLSNPLWQDSWPRSWGKADLDIGPIPDNQTRTSTALLTQVYFWYLLFVCMSMMFWWPKRNLWAEPFFLFLFLAFSIIILFAHMINTCSESPQSALTLEQIQIPELLFNCDLP